MIKLYKVLATSPSLLTSAKEILQSNGHNKKPHILYENNDNKNKYIHYT